MCVVIDLENKEETYNCNNILSLKQAILNRNGILNKDVFLYKYHSQGLSLDESNNDDLINPSDKYKIIL